MSSVKTLDIAFVLYWFGIEIYY